MASANAFLQNIGPRVKAFIQRGLERVGFVTHTEKVRVELRRQRVQEAADTPAGAYGDRDYGYRPTGRIANRDLNPLTQSRMHQIVLYQITTHPVAKRMVRILRNLLVSEGFDIRAKCKDPVKQARVQAVWDKHWNDRKNSWEKRLGARVREFLIYGEWCSHQFVRKEDGRTRIGMILPENIEDVVTHPMNSEQITHVLLKQEVTVTHADGTQVKRKKFEVIHEDEDPESPTYGYLVGEVFYWTLERMSGAKRGTSELQACVEWLDVLEQLMFSESERTQLIKNYVMDVQIKGADENALRAWKNEHQEPMRPGEFFVHNENIELKPQNAKLDHADSVVFIKWILIICMGSMGLPEHYFAEAPSRGNQTAAAEMDTPLFADIRAMQNVLKDCLLEQAEFVRDQAIIAGVLPEVGTALGWTEDDYEMEVIARDPQRKQYNDMGASLLSLSQALAGAEAGHWMTTDQCAKVFKLVAESYGVPIDDATALATAGTTDTKQGQVGAPKPGLAKPMPLNDMMAQAKKHLADREAQKNAGQGAADSTGAVGAPR